jgi:hypothetical protein
VDGGGHACRLAGALLETVRGRAGTHSHAPELFSGKVGKAVSKPKQLNVDSDDAERGRWPRKHRDRRLASLYDGTLEEAIPEDMLRLVRQIEAQLAGKG